MLAGESVTDQHPAWAWFRGRWPQTAGQHRRRPARRSDAGEIHLDVDCDALAAKVAAMVNGLELQWLLDPDGLDMAAVFADHTHSVRRVISVQPTDPPTTS